MDLTLDGRERDMLDSSRRLFAKVLDDAARADIEDHQAREPLREVMRQVGQHGWLTASGTDAPLLDRAPFFAAAGEALAPGLVSNAVAVGALLAARPDLQAAVESGVSLVTVACAAQDGLAVERAADGTRRVRGTLTLVEYGGVADLLVVVPDPPGATSDGAALLVDLGSTGVRRADRPTFGSDFRADLTLDVTLGEPDVVPLGAAPAAAGDVVATRAAIRLMECGGAARAVTRRTVSYVNTRHQFGKPLAQFQAVKQHAADMLILSEGAFLFAREALAATEKSGAAAAELWRAVSWVPRAFKDVTLWAHQLHGGMGYARESHLFRWSERAKLRQLELEALLTPAVVLGAVASDM
jgi:alkylation response protein AidB-like acyl-CoA dehydrogenase